MARLTRGFHILFTGDYYSRDAFHPALRTFKVGPSLQYFMTSFLELRMDFWGSRSLGSGSNYSLNDQYEFLGQVHLWF
jgi:hypothetical protein